MAEAENFILGAEKLRERMCAWGIADGNRVREGGGGNVQVGVVSEEGKGAISTNAIWLSRSLYAVRRPLHDAMRSMLMPCFGHMHDPRFRHFDGLTLGCWLAVAAAAASAHAECPAAHECVQVAARLACRSLVSCDVLLLCERLATGVVLALHDEHDARSVALRCVALRCVEQKVRCSLSMLLRECSRDRVVSATQVCADSSSSTPREDEDVCKAPHSSFGTYCIHASSHSPTCTATLLVV
ncbi:hypothetical protein IE81DRAFT_78246 [Ceraceosorus guamensis]|uniref:Uncharacterized protein n=1 Tax=Ceraceosorus guamensis TaxID=1522189 RepID=A0A316VMG1_9BASI|nr:hypothetical protein IE81DRAFT_78246 [Ceraceosorus guamensis]PWN38756.1 hypothetical protein IE81DRAFT_78246 [Ceraceosorus guamensis]